MFEKFGHDFYINFIKDDRYTWLLDGLKNTMIITVFALLIGICIGFLVAIIRSSHDKSGNFKIANSICRVYLTVIRGTPTGCLMQLSQPVPGSGSLYFVLSISQLLQ